jgi:hypothetical protein
MNCHHEEMRGSDATERDEGSAFLVKRLSVGAEKADSSMAEAVSQ